MLFDDLLEPFLDQRPVAVMTRACFEHAFAAHDLDVLFDRVATTQYEHRLTFSSLVELLGAIVTRRYSSVHAAYRADPAKLGASLSAVYDKLNHTEPALSEALLQHTATRMRDVLDAWTGRTQPFPGLRLRILDGNYLAGTDRRLKVLRGHGAAALPGMALVIQDHGSGLLTDLIVREDAYVNERALIEPVLERVAADDVIVADRNFCVRGLMDGIASRGAYFVIRHHVGLGLELVGDERAVGVSETGEVFEQEVAVGGQRYRCLSIRLSHPTRDGEGQIRVLTNLPAERGSGLVVAESYRLRWTLEATFPEVTRSVQCELNTLGYPRAALLTFALALCACNALRVVLRALEVAQGPAHPNEEVSSYYVVNELIAAYDGMEVVCAGSVWASVRLWTGPELATWLRQVATRAEWSKYRKTKRGPRTPVAMTTGGRKAPHRSTDRLLKTLAKLSNAPP